MLITRSSLKDSWHRIEEILYGELVSVLDLDQEDLGSNPCSAMKLIYLGQVTDSQPDLITALWVRREAVYTTLTFFKEDHGINLECHQTQSYFLYWWISERMALETVHANSTSAWETSSVHIFWNHCFIQPFISSTTLYSLWLWVLVVKILVAVVGYTSNSLWSVSPSRTNVSNIWMAWQILTKVLFTHLIQD